MSEGARTLEEAVEEFLARRRRGEPIEATAFAARHPALGPGLRDALEAAELMEAAHLEPALLGELEAGERLASFRLVREVGRGGMGVVFEAIEEPLGRRVALKVLPPEQLPSRSARARFRREAELASRLDHPGICTVYAAGVESDRPWIAMRFVEGATLARRVAEAREQGERGLQLPGEGAGSRTRALSVAACFARIARALAYAHERGVVHRDVKPANVMVTPEGDPVLLDFGLAREEESDAPSLTRTGETAGTPAYIAPDLLAGEIARPDARCDVYALGVSLYECLATRQPFRAPTRLALYREILAGTAPGLRQLVPELPRDLEVVVATAMERDRERRYASAADLAADLEAVVEGHPIAARPVSSVGRITRWARREPRQALLAALLATASLALALAGGILLASRDEVRAAERQATANEVERAIAAGFNSFFDEMRGGESSAEAADAEFLRALALEPTSIEALAGAIFVSYQCDRHEEAQERLARAPPLPIFDRLRLMLRGDPMLADDSWRDEASATELFLEGMRCQVEGWKLVSPAQRARVAGRALELFNEAVVRAPHARSLYHMARATAAFDAGDAEAARSAAAALLELWRDSKPELYAAGIALNQADPEASSRILERLVELDPDHWSAHHNLGTARVLLDRPVEAERAFLRAIELVPDHAHPYNGLGLALADQGRTEEAREAYLHALDLEPDFLEALSNLGALEIQCEDWSAAKYVLAPALELDPSSLELRYDYGTALYELHEFDGAREQFQYIVSRDPERSPQPWIALAWVQLDSGAPEQALETAERGLALHPDSAELVEARGEIRRALGLGD